MSPSSPLYTLERAEVGIVHLDADRRVVGMNDVARATLPVNDLRPFEREVLSFHPERSRAKVAFLLEQAAVCPVANPPPMTMIINIPERVLLIKVTRLSDVQSRPAGYTLVFYDITDAVSTETPESAGKNQRRRLHKIPTASSNQVVLVDTEKVSHLYSDGHYTWVVTGDAPRFCNLSISDIEARLDPDRFMRVHRSHIVNIGAVKAVAREGGRVVVRLVEGGAGVPVSRTSAPELLARLGVTNLGAVRQPASPDS